MECSCRFLAHSHKCPVPGKTSNRDATGQKLRLCSRGSNYDLLRPDSSKMLRVYQLWLRNIPALRRPSGFKLSGTSPLPCNLSPSAPGPRRRFRFRPLPLALIFFLPLTLFAVLPLAEALCVTGTSDSPAVWHTSLRYTRGQASSHVVSSPE